MQPANVKSVLVYGKNLDHTLFQVAISSAENGFHVWFISPETFDSAPKNVKAPDKEILQLITFMYLKDQNNLLSHLNGIHLWRKSPDIIIVTRFESYCKLYSTEYNPLQAALLLTTLLDSTAVCALKKKETVNLLVTCDEPKDNQKNRLQILKDLYFSNYVHKSDDDEEFYCKMLQLLK